MNLRIFDSTDDLIRAAARTILQRTAGADTFSIALSGGSTPKPLYELLGSGEYRERLAAKRITWVVVDERYVPLDDPQSNASMMMKTLFREGVSANHQFLRFRTELNDPERTAVVFEEEWKKLGLSQLDIVLLGTGEDGHTASLFPGTSVLDVVDRIAAAVFVPRLNQWRVTLTLPVIRDATLRLLLVAGDSKKSVIAAVRDGVDYPVRRATSGDIETWWMVDRNAAP